MGPHMQGLQEGQHFPAPVVKHVSVRGSGCQLASYMIGAIAAAADQEHKKPCVPVNAPVCYEPIADRFVVTIDMPEAVWAGHFVSPCAP